MTLGMKRTYMDISLWSAEVSGELSSGAKSVILILVVKVLHRRSMDFEFLN